MTQLRLTAIALALLSASAHAAPADCPVPGMCKASFFVSDSETFYAPGIEVAQASQPLDPMAIPGRPATDPAATPGATPAKPAEPAKGAQPPSAPAKPANGDTKGVDLFGTRPKPAATGTTTATTQPVASAPAASPDPASKAPTPAPAATASASGAPAAAASTAASPAPLADLPFPVTAATPTTPSTAAIVAKPVPSPAPINTGTAKVPAPANNVKITTLPPSLQGAQAPIVQSPLGAAPGLLGTQAPPATAPEKVALPPSLLPPAPPQLDNEPRVISETGVTREAIEAETITVTPGVNQIITVARHHLTRVVTPIFKPAIRTSSSADIDPRGSVLYISPRDDRPIELFITQQGIEEPAIAVTLLPKAVPPKEVRLRLTDDSAINFTANASAQNWEQEQPYVSTLRSIMRSLAQGAVPPGYALRRHTGRDPAVFCADPYLKVTPVQVVEGHNLIVTVSSAKNIAGRDITINELQCQLPAVAAVAAYPTPFLRPGQATELYMVHRRLPEKPSARSRPSVIDPDYLR